jgi:hypothetical protein
MSFPEQHELHKRRFGRNLGLGIVLVGFIALIFALTIAKAGGKISAAANAGATAQPVQVEN